MSAIAAFISLLLWTCVQGTWFPEMGLTSTQWEDVLQGYDVASSYTKCTNINTGAGSAQFISMYRERPATIVLTGAASGRVDVKFKDSTYTFDHEYEVSKDSYLVIPPYQPVEWLWLRSRGSINICAYESM